MKKAVHSILSVLCLYALAEGSESESVTHLNPSHYVINNYIEHVCGGTRFSPELVKAIAWHESNWRQFDKRGNPTFSGKDWGIMRINERTARKSRMDLKRIKTDWRYNVRCGVQILETKYRQVPALQKQKNWARICRENDLEGVDQLHIALKLYNGMQPDWTYVWAVAKARCEKPWIKMIGGEER